MTKVVIDASVAASWCFEDMIVEPENSLLSSAENGQFVVPQHWALEVANALLMGLRSDRTTRELIRESIQALSLLPIVVDRFTFAAAFARTLELSFEHSLTSYDAAYLELALRLELPFATLDRRLRVAAGSVGVEVFES